MKNELLVKFKVNDQVSAKFVELQKKLQEMFAKYVEIRDKSETTDGL